MIILHRSQVQLQTVSNLISAGILEPTEAESYNKLLSAMPLDDVLAALLESHELKDNLNYYPIGEISKN